MLSLWFSLGSFQWAACSSAWHLLWRLLAAAFCMINEKKLAERFLTQRAFKSFVDKDY